MKRTDTPRTKYTEREIANIKGMVARGDRQWDVGVWFGINSARVNEIVHATGAGKRYAHIPPATDDLPPKGPYTVLPTSQAEAYRCVIRELELLVEQFKTKLGAGPNVERG